jgi:alpha-D-ribose 1-methylphosphonate 5-triphosphate synthase subunit PhnI
MACLGINDMKTLLAAAALAISSAVTAQAADIFTCSALGYATHDGRVERACSAPVTTHWMKLGERLSALVYYRDEPDGLHVVVTTHQGVREKAVLERFETVLAAGQSAAFSIPRAASEASERVVLTNAGGHLQIAEPAAAVSAR